MSDNNVEIIGDIFVQLLRGCTKGLQGVLYFASDITPLYENNDLYVWFVMKKSNSIDQIMSGPVGSFESEVEEVLWLTTGNTWNAMPRKAESWDLMAGHDYTFWFCNQ